MAIIFTRKGEAILVDDDDYPDLSRFVWYINEQGYAVHMIRLPDGREVMERMHRRVMGLSYGDPRQVDHRFGKKLDNRKSELRICTHAQNQRNSSIRKDNKSGIKGVRFRDNRWIAEIGYNGKSKYLGAFDSAEEAFEFRCLAAELLYGDFANHTAFAGEMK
jgi:hypothetical protein